MLKKFKELFGTENLLEKAFSTTITMLEYDSKMYEAARHVLRASDNADLPFDFKKMDRKINKYERAVRRDVLTHLTVAGTTNLVPGLVLVSIVVDVERIGDYTKNIVDLARHHEARLEGGSYEKKLSQIEAVMEDQFKNMIPMLKEQDKKVARKMMQAEEETGLVAGEIVNGLLAQKDKKLTVSDSVALALYARYLKRINAHLTNIASAVVNPFPRISFREKSTKSKSDSKKSS